MPQVEWHIKLYNNKFNKTPRVTDSSYHITSIYGNIDIIFDIVFI